MSVANKAGKAGGEYRMLIYFTGRTLGYPKILFTVFFVFLRFIICNSALGRSIILSMLPKSFIYSPLCVFMCLFTINRRFYVC